MRDDPERAAAECLWAACRALAPAPADPQGEALIERVGPNFSISRILSLAPFFVLVGVAYGIFTGFEEPVGYLTSGGYGYTTKIPLSTLAPGRYVLRISAKTGEGVGDLLDAVIARVPPPTGEVDEPLQALIFDSHYDAYRGVICYIRVIDGTENICALKVSSAMLQVIAQTGFKGSFDEFLTYLRTDPKFRYTDPQQLLQAYQAMAKRVDPLLPQYFGKLPRMPYGVKPVPEIGPEMVA